MKDEVTYSKDDYKLCYAMLDGEMIHINQVSSGIVENCLCPKCGSLLIAKKGDIRKHHFAHYNYEHCQGAQETALHLLAKEILYQEKNIVVPIEGSNDYEAVSFERVSLEVREHGLIFDALGYFGAETLAIEIKVTHEIDERKREIVINKGIQMIEIDLSKHLNGEYTIKEITDAVLHSAPRYWIIPIANTYYESEEKEMLENKATITGFKLACGFSRKNNCNFESNKIFLLQEVENKSTVNYQVSACGGYEVQQMDIVDDRALIEKISAFSFPAEVSLTIEPVYQRNKLRPLVTDVNVT